MSTLTHNSVGTEASIVTLCLTYQGLTSLYFDIVQRHIVLIYIRGKRFLPNMITSVHIDFGLKVNTS